MGSLYDISTAHAQSSAHVACLHIHINYLFSYIRALFFGGRGRGGGGGGEVLQISQ